MGSLSDRFGRRGALAIGLAIMGVGSVLSSFATSADQLIGTRAIMGIGAAMIMPSSLSIITNVFTVPGSGRRPSPSGQRRPAPPSPSVRSRVAGC